MDTCQDLVSRGADVNYRDGEGESIIYRAVAANAHSSVRILLQIGADCQTVNGSVRQTVLHSLASDCGEEMVALFEAVSLAG